jgi:hypothetical protein
MWIINGLHALQPQKVSFVTRLRPKSVYSVLKINDTRNIQGVIADEVIQLDSEHAKKRGAPKLRRVEYYDANTQENVSIPD